jgi:Flp pilus assembly protein TadG
VTVRAGRRRGQGIVEFALIAPLVFALIFGIIDLGRAVFFQIELNNAVRDGARVAILASNPCNTYVGNNNGCIGVQTNGVSGTTVCQAIQKDTALISTYHNCVDGAANSGTSYLSSASSANCAVVVGKATCSGIDNDAYVEINQVCASAGQTGCMSAAAATTCSTTVVTPSGYTTYVPRTGGNLPVQVKIVYFYRPITPFLNGLFPQHYFLYASACLRPEF